MNVIKSIDGLTGCNYPANLSTLVEAGLTEAQAQSALDAHFIAQKWHSVRAQREPLLVTADHAINECEDTGADATAWRAYRQALRDITEQPDPFNIIWPEQPAG